MAEADCTPSTWRRLGDGVRRPLEGAPPLPLGEAARRAGEGGRPLQFGPGADGDALFAFHVELLFFLIAPLYLLHAGPETLIVLLTAGIALGALPVYWIARRQLGQWGAALLFAAVYLLVPS